MHCLLAALQISKGDLEVVRQAKARLDGQLTRVAGVKEELEDLLDDDQDMRNMYLGRQVLEYMQYFPAACDCACLHLPLSGEALGRQSAAQGCGRVASVEQGQVCMLPLLTQGAGHHWEHGHCWHHWEHAVLLAQREHGHCWH